MSDASEAASPAAEDVPPWPSRILEMAGTRLQVALPADGGWHSDDDFAELEWRRFGDLELATDLRAAAIALGSLSPVEFDLLRALLALGRRPTPGRASWRRRFLGATAAPGTPRSRRRRLRHGAGGASRAGPLDFPPHRHPHLA